MAAPRLIATVLLTTAVLAGAAPASADVVVRDGQTLWEIARAHGVSVSRLADANAIADPDLVRAGARLAIPGGTAEVPAGGAGNPAVRDAVGRLLRDSAADYGWRPAVPMALAMVESGWNNGVVSERGGVGIMQVLPATERWLEANVLDRELDLGDPADNVEAGIAYLDWLYRNLDRDVELALAAYYEGYGRVSDRGPSQAASHYAATVLAVTDDL